MYVELYGAVLPSRQSRRVAKAFERGILRELLLLEPSRHAETCRRSSPALQKCSPEFFRDKYGEAPIQIKSDRDKWPIMKSTSDARLVRLRCDLSSTGCRLNGRRMTFM